MLRDERSPPLPPFLLPPLLSLRPWLPPLLFAPPLLPPSLPGRLQLVTLTCRESGFKVIVVRGALHKLVQIRRTPCFLGRSGCRSSLSFSYPAHHFVWNRAFIACKGYASWAYFLGREHMGVTAPILAGLWI